MDYSSDSDSVATNSTFEDSYYDPASELSYEFRQSNLYNYVADAQSAIQNHDDISIENALILNAKYRQLLEDLRTKFEKMLLQVKEKYAANEILLEKLRSTVPGKQISMRYSSIYICGAPYFKDQQLNPSPMNPDYVYRKDIMQEFFPVDFLSQIRRQWMVSDKMDIIQGVKEQIVNFLKAQNSSSISTIRNQNKISRSMSKKIASIREITADFENRPFNELYSMVKCSDLEIDWNKISFKNLDSRHSVAECEAMWKHYLRPDLNHDSWTREEDETLLNAIISNNYQSWEEIAATLGNRSALHCFVHYRTTLSESAQVKKGEKFDAFEDEQLLELVEKFTTGGAINWSKVCQQMPGRNRYQCYHRYMFTIKPGIKKDRFTTEEDCVILAYVQMHGENFGKMPPSLLPGRTGVQIRNRYKNTLQHKGNATWTTEEDERLWNFVAENGTTQWSQISKILKTKTRFACRCRYQTITKHLKKYPNSTIRDIPTKSKTRSTPLDKDNFASMVQTLNPTDPSEISRELTRRKFEDVSKKKRRRFTDKPIIYFPTDDASMVLHEYMKYSYNYVYSPRGKNFNFTEDEIVRDYVVLQMLDFELCKIDFNHRFNCMSLRNQSQLGMALQVQPTPEMMEGIRMAKTVGVQFAPNWNTVIAFRGILMMLNGQSGVADRSGVMNYYPALELFKRRYIQMFYWTALVAKLKMNCVQEHWNQRCQVETRVIDENYPEPEIILTKEEPPEDEENDPTEIVEVQVVEDADDAAEEDKEEEEGEYEEDSAEEENAVDFLLNFMKEMKDVKSNTAENECVFEITCLDDNNTVPEQKPSMPSWNNT